MAPVDPMALLPCALMIFIFTPKFELPVNNWIKISNSELEEFNFHSKKGTQFHENKYFVEANSIVFKIVTLITMSPWLLLQCY